MKQEGSWVKWKKTIVTGRKIEPFRGKGDSLRYGGSVQDVLESLNDSYSFLLSGDSETSVVSVSGTFGPRRSPVDPEGIFLGRTLTSVTSPFVPGSTTLPFHPCHSSVGFLGQRL